MGMFMLQILVCCIGDNKRCFFRGVFFYRCRLLFLRYGNVFALRKKSFYEIRGNDDALVLEHLAQLFGIVAFLLRLSEITLQ